MNRVIIRNIGPIKQVDFELNKINVLMGPQSSGKSTIAKIISFCQWVEKRCLIDDEFKQDAKIQLLDFHRLSENYFVQDSYFAYETDFVSIKYTGKNLKPNIKKKKTTEIYKKSKNIYIPSERNFVSVIPNLSKFKETNDNIMSFVYDWFLAKREFSSSNLLSVLNLGVSFYNKPDNDNDVLKLSHSKEILLREGSSGLQSLIPLIVLIEYLTEYIYKSRNTNSIEEQDAIRSLILKKITALQLSNQGEINAKDLKQLTLSILNLSQYHFSNFILEEPEQNLFPSTQRDLINYLFEKINGERPHSLLLTTHSPYILYAINNCLMGYNVRHKIEADNEDITNEKSWINPDLVSIWQVQNGELHSVKDETTKTVTKHYFNEITKDIMDEYLEMLSYYEYNPTH